MAMPSAPYGTPRAMDHAVMRYVQHVEELPWNDARKRVEELACEAYPPHWSFDGSSYSVITVRGTPLTLVWDQHWLVTLYWQGEGEEDMATGTPISRNNEPCMSFVPSDPNRGYLNAPAARILGFPEFVDITQVNTATLLITPGRDIKMRYNDKKRRGGSMIYIAPLQRKGWIAKPDDGASVVYPLSRGNGNALLIHPNRQAVQGIPAPEAVSAVDDTPDVEFELRQPEEAAAVLPPPTTVPATIEQVSIDGGIAWLLHGAYLHLRKRESLLLTDAALAEVRANWARLSRQMERFEMALMALEDFEKGDDE